MRRKHAKTLADCTFDKVPECFHCEKPLPKSTKVSIENNVLIAQCPACGCMTPFRVT